MAKKQGLSSYGSFTLALTELQAFGRARRAMFGLDLKPGSFPAPWVGPQLSLVNVDESSFKRKKKHLGVDKPKEKPPTTLPDYLLRRHDR